MIVNIFSELSFIQYLFFILGNILLILIGVGLIWKVDKELILKKYINVILVSAVMAVILLGLSFLIRNEYSSGTPFWHMYSWPKHILEFARDGNNPAMVFQKFRVDALFANIFLFFLIAFPFVFVIKVFSEIPKSRVIIILFLEFLSIVSLGFTTMYNYSYDSRINPRIIEYNLLDLLKKTD